MSGTVVLMERKNVCQFSVLEPYLTILPVLSVKTRYRASVIDKAPSRTEQFIFQFLQSAVRNDRNSACTSLLCY
jgi:hypothetical protein